jgi:hypothetical protein
MSCEVSVVIITAGSAVGSPMGGALGGVAGDPMGIVAGNPMGGTSGGSSGGAAGGTSGNPGGSAEGLLDLVATVLPQLGAEDEIIVVVEPPSPGLPSDMTREVAAEIARQSPAVRVLVREDAGMARGRAGAGADVLREGVGAGESADASREGEGTDEGTGAKVLAACEQGIRAARGTYVFFAEPGDLWAPDKVSCAREVFAASDAALILHDAELLDAVRRVLAPSLFAVRESQWGFREGLLHSSCLGSCLAFRRPLQDYFLPFPPEAPRYEQWIGCVAERFGGVALITKPLIGKMMMRDGRPVLTTMSAREQRREQRGMRKALRQREKELRREGSDRPA